MVLRGDPVALGTKDIAKLFGQGRVFWVAQAAL